eukprot:scaffold58648_cov71-Phaeocystis_antarctica.AAC.2
MAVPFKGKLSQRRAARTVRSAHGRLARPSPGAAPPRARPPTAACLRAPAPWYLPFPNALLLPTDHPPLLPPADKHHYFQYA